MSRFTYCKFFIPWILLLIILIGCGSDEDRTNADRDIKVLEQMLDIVEMNSINRKKLDWRAIEQSVLDIYNDQGFNFAVRLLLKELGDNHSFYLSSSNQSLSSSEINCGRSYSIPSLENDSIAYLQVGGFSGSQKEGLQFAQNIQDEISRQDGPNVKGFVVDLTQNTGGNMYPMISGLGPLLGDGIHGYFIDPDGDSTPWGYQATGSFIGTPSNRLFELPASYDLKSPNSKIAVIIDNQTASSGEATLISFMAREDVLIIGIPSCGLSTANQSFNLRNGARLFLTVSTMADRNRVLFGDRIAPDIETDDPDVIRLEVLNFFNR